MKRAFVINDDQSKFFAIQAVKNIGTDGKMQVVIEPETRDSIQNNHQWPYLDACAKQLVWEVEGELVKMSEIEWKDLITAGYTKEKFRVAKGIDGGVVMVGKRTSFFTKKQWPEYMEYLKWFCADQGVKVPLSKREAENWGLE